MVNKDTGDLACWKLFRFFRNRMTIKWFCERCTFITMNFKEVKQNLKIINQLHVNVSTSINI